MPVGFDVDVTVNLDVASGTREGVRRYLLDGMSKGYAVSLEEAPEDRGTLKQTSFSPEWRGDELVWGYTAPQAGPMEYGTKPFHPPVQPLVEWAERVSGDPGLGYYVANVKIPEEGIDAQPFVAPGVEAAKSWFRSNDVRRYTEDARE